MNENNTISVVVPAYNSGAFIADAINSILAQNTKVDEIVVVDDGSTDNTAKIIAAFPMVKYIYQNNSGPAAARNRGIAVASSRWIAFLDSDDIWNKDHIEKTISKIKKYGLVWSCGGYVFSHIKEGRIYNHAKWKDLLINGDMFADLFSAKAEKAPLHLDGFIIKRSIFQEIGMFDEKFKFYEDFDIFCRIAYKYSRLGFVWPPTVIRHKIPGSVSSVQYYNIVTLLEKHRKLLDSYGRHESIRFLPVAKTFAKDALWQSIAYNDKVSLKIVMSKYSSLLGIYRFAGWFGLYISINSMWVLFNIVIAVKQAINSALNLLLHRS